MTSRSQCRFPHAERHRPIVNYSTCGSSVPTTCGFAGDIPSQPVRENDAMTAQQRLTELGIELPTPMTPAGMYRSLVRVGDLIFLSGAGPMRPDGSFVTGKVGGAVSLESGREAARLVGLQLLAALQAELGSLDKVTRVVKLLGMVNCAPGFNETPGSHRRLLGVVHRGLRRERARGAQCGWHGRAAVRHLRRGRGDRSGPSRPVMGGSVL